MTTPPRQRDLTGGPAHSHNRQWRTAMGAESVPNSEPKWKSEPATAEYPIWSIKPAITPEFVGSLGCIKYELEEISLAMGVLAKNLKR